MPPLDPQTVLLTSDLGPVGNYDPTSPLARVTTKHSLVAGRLYLRATLDEIIRIRSMSRSLGLDRDQDHRLLLRETISEYDNLLRQKKKLESLDKGNWLSKVFKSKSVKNAIRAFASDAYDLWDSTATTSDRMKRTFLSTLSTDLAPVEGQSVSEDEQLAGLAVDMNGPVTQEGIDAMLSILASINSPTSPDGESSTMGTTLTNETSRNSVSTSPGSPGSAPKVNVLNLNVNYNVINNSDSTTPGLTINNNGSQNSGSACVVTDYGQSGNASPS